MRNVLLEKVGTNFNQTWHRYFFGEENLSPRGDDIEILVVMTLIFVLLIGMTYSRNAGQISINPDTNIKFSWMLGFSTGRNNN